MRAKGLAYLDETNVNWDPIDQTVLANEQIDSNGRSWRSGALVQKRKMKQWYLDIRKYAEEMLREVEDEGCLKQWPKAVRESQRGWIGREMGKAVKGKLGRKEIKVFLKNDSLPFLKQAKYLAINHDIKPEKLRDLLSPEDFNRFQQYLEGVNSLEVTSANLKDIKQLEPGL